VVKAIGGLVPALLGGPVVAGVVIVVAVMAGALCWVVADARRTEHLYRLIRAVRGGGRGS
jgi:hypothetical protein